MIAEQGGPLYDAVFDLDSGDLRGITQAYLYRTDRVELLEAMEDDPVLGSMPTVDYDGAALPFNSDVQNPKALNAELPARVANTCGSAGPVQCDGSNVFSRGPQVGLFRIWRDAIGRSTFTDVYLVNNHQSAGPDRRVFQRREQATYNARIAEAVVAEDPAARVLVGGDLNVFPRPDDPFRPGQPIALGEVGPSDQLRALYESPLTNLYDTMLAWYPTAAYTFGFQGQAQTLDHLFVSPTLLDELVDVRSAKINVDWPADAAGETPAYGRFGASDHDPEAGTFGAISIERVRELLAMLVDDGRLNRGTANSVLSRLDNAERFLARGQQRQAMQQLQSAIRQLSTPGGGGAGDLGPYLARELELLLETFDS